MHRSQAFLITCLAFLAGVALSSWWAFSEVLFWGCVSCGGVLLFVRRPVTTVVGLALIAAVVGGWRTHEVLGRSSVLWDIAHDKPAVTVTGYVDGDFERTTNGGRFTFRVRRIEYAGSAIETDDRLLVSGPDWIRPRQGQWLVVTGKIQQANVFDDFDYASYLAKDGIHAVMYFPTYSVPMENDLSRVVRLRAWATGRLATVRIGVMESIARAIPEPESGYLAGLLVGAKGNVNAQLKEAFARTGTSHIVALSGYNITIIVTVLMTLLAALGKRRSYWLAVVSIALFAIMVGASASVVRAAVMGVLTMTATRMGRLSDAGITMAATAAAMCFYNPAVLRWDVGFQLSFLAFAGIVFIQPLIEPFIVRLLRWKSLATIVSTTLAAQVLVLPLLLYVFGMLAVYTLPVNVLVLPLVPLAMGLGFATAIAGALWSWAGIFVGQSAWLVATVQLGIIRFAATMPYAALEISLSATAVVAVYIGLVVWLISLYRGRVVLTTNQEVTHAGTHTRTVEAGRGGQGNPGGNHLPF